MTVSTSKITADPTVQKQVFDGVAHFLNTAFGNINIRKFHNTAPNISFGEYNELSLGKKIVSTIYGKEWKLFYKDIITGGNCHHWTLILKAV